MILQKLLLLCTVFLSSFFTYAQIDTEFWFAVPEITEGHADAPVYLRISTFDQAANVTVSIPSNPLFPSFKVTIAANSTATIDLTYDLDQIENSIPDLVSNKGLKIESTAEITAYYEVLGTNYLGVVNCDIFCLKGRNALGKKFYTPFQNHWSNYPGIEAWSSFDIVAQEDGTEVTITPSKNIVGHPANVPFTIRLNKGQTYSARAVTHLASGHLSGSVIVSNKPIAVTIKDDSIFDTNNWDLAGDQLISVEKTGMEYIAINASGNLHLDRVFITATEDATTVALPDTSIELQGGETYNYQLPLNYNYILSNKPIYVFHMSGFNPELAGALLPPISCTGSRQVSFTRPTKEKFALNLLVKKGGEMYFELNGSSDAISPSAFTDIPGTHNEWVGTQLYFSNESLATGIAHTVSNSQYDFHLGVLNGGPITGFRFGYFSDFGFLELGDDKSLCKGDSVLLNAGFGKTSYLWNNDNKFTSQHLSVKDSGTYHVKVTKGTCTLTDSIKIHIYPEAILDLGSDTSICPESDHIISSNSSFSSYVWQDGSTSSYYIPEASGTYTLTVKNEFGCMDVDAVNITIYDSPEANIKYNPDLKTICWDSTITLTSEGIFKRYLWNTGDTSQIISAPHLPEYTLKVTDFNNCTDTTSIVIDCSPEVKVYNLVTPNNDGMNDVFYVEGLQENKWILEVYNQWGDRIYYNPAYRNEYDGSENESGIYYFLLSHVEGKKIIKGWMHVVQ